MALAIDQASRESYLFVQFHHGEDQAQIERYTDWQQDVSGFKSTPLMEVEIPPNGGEFGEREGRVVLPLDTFTDRLSDDLPHSPVFLRIEERTLGLTAGEAGTVRVLARARVKRVTRNHQRRLGMVAAHFLGIKSRLDIPLGFQCNHYDEARLFGPMSGLTQSAFDVLGQIATIDGQEITISANAQITNPTAPGGDNNRFWEAGWLEKDGLRIGIHQWNRLDDPAFFILREQPPNDWLLAGSSSILFVPGTHGSLEEIRAVWDDEEHFLGLGYGIATYNPLFERNRSSRTSS